MDFLLHIQIMKKCLLLLLFVAPVWLMSQDVKNGGISFDFGKKKKQAADSVVQPSNDENEDTVIAKPRKEKRVKDTTQQTTHHYQGYDYKKDGIFFGLFHAGVNAAQVDGDNEYQYKYLGFEGGIGALARFDKIFSLSLELNYSMKGARARLGASSSNAEKYAVQWDYVEAPIAVNAHYKKMLVFSIGVDPGYQVRYKEINYDGLNVTNSPPPLNQSGPPRKFDLCGFGGMQVVFKDHYSIGGTFSYSMLKIRNAVPGDRIESGEYNNYLTLDFKYILGKVKKKS
jgi:hypothetical protein